METIDIQREFKSKVCEEISVELEGENRYRILTPFMFGDGDHLAITLKKEKDKWVLTDEGDTYMHLSILGVKPGALLYGTRRRILNGVLEEFSLKDRLGELIFEIKDNDFGFALYSFSQALLKISDLTYLSKEQVKYAFLEDFRNLITEAVPIERCAFQWESTEHGKHGKYSVDCRINSMQTPLMLFALQTEQKTLKSIITIHQLEKWGIPFHPIGIFKNMTEISINTVAKFSDVCKKTYSNIEEEENRIRVIKHLKELTAASN